MPFSAFGGFGHFYFRLGKRACPLKNKNALSALLKGHCAQDWIRTSTPRGAAT